MTTRNAGNLEKKASEIAAEFRSSLSAGANPAQALQGLLLKLKPLPWRLWRLCGQYLIQAELPLAASEVLNEAVRRWPQRPELRCWSGNALRMARQFVDAESVHRQVLQAHPDYEDSALSLAFMLRELGRLDAACEVITNFWKAKNGDADTSLRCGRFIEECQRQELAMTLYERQIGEVAQNPLLLFCAGQCAMTLGRFEIGRERCLAAVDAGLDLDDWPGVWLRLANAQRYTSKQHPDFARFERALRDAAPSSPRQAAAGFAYGKALDDIGDYAAAAKILRSANRSERARRRWSVAAWEASIATQISTKPMPVVAVADTGSNPVFIVGLPRTGTSLLAERLTRHPQLRNRGELNWLPFLDKQLAVSGRRGDPQALQEAATIYRTQLLQDDARARWYIDKNPLNFRHLGLIAALFPHARVIHCRRERRDTALSIWSQMFAPGDLDFAYDLTDIRACAEAHDRLMAHWHGTLSLKIHTVDYESLVSMPRQILGQLGVFLDLSPSDWIDSNTGPSAVISTASVWQARQAVHTQSVGRWQSYGTLLPELTELFGSA